jgi:hypothetical protein
MTARVETSIRKTPVQRALAGSDPIDLPPYYFARPGFRSVIV